MFDGRFIDALDPVPLNDGACTVPANDAFPPELNVDVALGVWRPWDPAPVTNAVLVSDAALVTTFAATTPLSANRPPVAELKSAR